MRLKYYQLKAVIGKGRILSPEFYFLGGFHLSLAAGTGVMVPKGDAVASAMQAQTADAAAERGCDIANDATDNKVLNALAVGTTDGDDLLSEESTAFIIVGFVATLGAAVGFLPRHNWLVMS